MGYRVRVSPAPAQPTSRRILISKDPWSLGSHPSGLSGRPLPFTRRAGSARSALRTRSLGRPEPDGPAGVGRGRNGLAFRDAAGGRSPLSLWPGPQHAFSSLPGLASGGRGPGPGVGGGAARKAPAALRRLGEGGGFAFRWREAE
ncbi:hCG1988097 [Homo sapiens]|uniref:HCG1988097 n=1 Tax=Homo sapiens TaxID=9606 RepID=A0A090N7T1_HUMAN